MTHSDSAAPLDPIPQFQHMIGKRFDRYEIRDVLGRGGMGEVYIAFDTKLKRLVALKILLDKHVEDSSYLIRFQQEARSASALNHPHILTVYDIGFTRGRHFIAMELIEGETVRVRLQQKAFEIEEAVEIAIQVADALVVAHRASIVHRDIKPENIMLRNQTYVKLLDFGLAKVTNSDGKSVTETASGLIMGTPRYMSPEQAIGHGVDGRTDIWSLGVVLFEMVTGSPPFDGTSVTETIKAILTKEPKQLSHYKVVHPDFESVIKKTLTKNSEDRYNDALELMAALKAIKGSVGSGRHQLLISTQGAAPAPVGLATVKHNPGEILVARSPHRRRKSIRSLAILPFANDDSSSCSDYLSDGLTETIINTLSQLPQLRVMARSSVFRFKGRQENLLAIGNELGVAAVLTGRVQRLQTNLVVQTELVDIADGSQLWGTKFNKKTGDIFQIQEEIAQEISEKLKLNLSANQKKRLSKRQTTNEIAYHAYLKGRFNWNKRSTEGLRQSLRFFNQAIENDPLYALAYAGLADAYAVMGNQHSMQLSEAYAKAKAAAHKALEMDATLAEAYPTLGFIKGAYDRDWAGSEEAFKRAISLNPGYATAHQWYSSILRALGRVEEAIEEAQMAFSLDPLSPIISANVGLCLYVARRYDEAIDHFQKMLVVEPSFFWTHYLLGLTQRQKGQHNLAVAELQMALSLASDKRTEAVVISDLAYSHGIRGEYEEANRLIKELSTLATVCHVSPYDLAIAYLGVGDKDEAFNWLNKADESRDEGLLWLKIDPVLDEVRDDSRYLTLLERAGLSRAD